MASKYALSATVLCECHYVVVYTASNSEYVSYADETTRVGTLSRSTWLAQVSSATRVVTITFYTWWSPGLHSERKSRILMFVVESALFEFLMKKQQPCHHKYCCGPFMVATIPFTWKHC